MIKINFNINNKTILNITIKDGKYIDFHTNLGMKVLNGIDNEIQQLVAELLKRKLIKKITKNKIKERIRSENENIFENIIIKKNDGMYEIKEYYYIGSSTYIINTKQETINKIYEIKKNDFVGNLEFNLNFDNQGGSSFGLRSIGGCFVDKEKNIIIGTDRLQIFNTRIYGIGIMHLFLKEGLNKYID